MSEKAFYARISFTKFMIKVTFSIENGGGWARNTFFTIIFAVTLTSTKKKKRLLTRMLHS